MAKIESSNDAKTGGKNTDSEKSSMNSKYLFTNQFSIVNKKLINLLWSILFETAFPKTMKLASKSWDNIASPDSRQQEDAMSLPCYFCKGA